MALVNLVKTAVLSACFIGAALAKDYEYIIVGAGSAGSVLASKLARSGAEVLLLEAGGDNTDPAIDSLYSYFNVAFNTFNYGFLQWGLETTNQTFSGVVEGAPAKTVQLPSGKALGGTFNINAAAYVQAHSSDFDDIAATTGDNQWKWIRNRGKRKTLARVLNITKLDETQSGAAEFIQAANDILGFPFNDWPLDGDQYGISPSFWSGEESSEGGIRTTSYDAFLRPLLKKGNLDVITYHQVKKLLFDDQDPTKVVGVEAYNSRANIDTVFTATKEVILSAGTYNSPKILMLSGIGPQAHLAEHSIPVVVDLPGVGSNLRDHYGVATFWNLGANAVEDAPFLFQSPALNMFGPEATGPTSFQFELSGNYGAVIPLRLQSTGTVRLSSTDFTTNPLIDPNILGTSGDIDIMVDGMLNYLMPFFKELVDKQLVTPASIDPTSTEAQIREFVIANVGTNHHPAGTCKVGADSDSMAVLDSNFYVRGTSNLRVVDASVFPTVPSGNTNASTMLVALLAWKKIKQSNPAMHAFWESDEDDEGDRKLLRTGA